MLKGISKWKRLLAIVLTVVMLFTNDYGLLRAFALEADQGGAQSNLEVTASLVINDGKEKLLTGETFQYILQYNTPNNASQYVGSKLVFTLPQYVELAKDSEGNFRISGVEYVSIESFSTNGGVRYVISLKSPLAMHATNTLTIIMKTRTLVTPDDLVLDFNKGFTFQTQIGEGDGAQTFQVKAGTVTTEAASNWEITKANITKNGTLNYVRVGDKFEVTYSVKVEDKNGVDNNGRLGFTAYQVVDTLPTIPDGVVNGEAIEVKDVKLIHRGTPENLVLGTDYTVTTNADGKPVSITFNKADTIRTTEESQYLQIGDITDTTYEYTLVYPYAPYTTSGDEANIIEHSLQNTATLNYTLVGGATGQKTSQAVVNIGEWEDNTPTADIKVKKYVKYSNGTEELLDEATAAKFGFTGNNTVKFTLYKNPACTEVAYNVGTETSPRAQMSDMAVNANGEVTFPNIRKGTYYIKEVTQREGWDEAGVIEVVVNEDGTVTYPDGKDYFTAVNTATAFNAVEFTKTGVDVNGVTSNGLAGVKFELSSGDNKYYATSNANGTVRFDNIPDGTYTLKEYALVGSSLEGLGYVVSNATFTIVLAGGEVERPVLHGDNTFKNISPKGYLTIVKEDETNDNKLAGATFEVYGPFADEAAADSADLSAMEPKTTLTTVGANGSITSGPLTEGVYVLKEVQAPANYVINETTTKVTVLRQTTVSVTVDNIPQIKVFFHKQGADKANGGPKQELYGTQFKLYDNSGNVLYGTKSGNATTGFNYTNVSTTQGAGQEVVILTTVSDGSMKAVSGYVQLSPGQYKYEEIAVPAPFTPDSGLKTFTVNEVNQENGSWVYDQLETVDNYLKNGQIRVVKKVSNKTTPEANDVNGAKFGVYGTYADAQNGTNLLQEITTGTYMENGVLVHGIGYSTATLTIGATYYVKEIAAPAGYAVNNTITPVTPSAQAPQVPVECTNDPTVSIKIIKVDSLDPSNTLEGATFNLYKDADGTQKVNTTPVGTDGNGVVVFGDLDPDTIYYYEEVTAPNGYIKVEGRHEIRTGINGAQVEKKVSNTPLVRLEITKKDSTDSPKKLDGAQFDLYKDEAGTQRVNTTPVTTVNGVAVFEGLTPGQIYYYQEVKAPTGYLLDNAVKPIEIGQNTALVEISVNNDPLVDIKITKKDSVTGADLSGAVFELYESTTGAAVKTGTTTNGVLTFTDLVPGKTYYIKEKTPPTGYYITNSNFITVVAGTNGETVTVPVTNAPLANITITKKDSVTGALLNGAVFELYESVGDEAKQTATTVNGVVTFTGLMPGTTYYIKETTVPTNYVKVTTAPEGYQMDANGFIDFTAGEDTEITVENDRKGTLKLHKTTGVSGETASFGGVTFRLFAAPAGSTAPDLTATPIGTQTTANNGDASFENLTPGDYWLVETVKENYVSSTTPSGWDGTTTVDGTQYFYKKVTVSVGENISTEYGAADIEQIHNTPTKGQLSIKKYAANANGGTGSALNGVKFTIYSDAECQNEVATIETKNGGIATSGYLTPGTYYVKETAVPANSDYILSDTVYTVVVEAGKIATSATVGNKSVSLESIINKKTGDFTIQKKKLYTITTVDKDGNISTETVDQILTGATFTLYKSDVNGAQGVVVKTITITSDNATYTFTDLEPGYYLLVETTAPTGYVAGPNEHIHVKADGTVEINVLNNGQPNWNDVTSTVIINNKPNTKLQLTKKDAYTGTGLAGARFEVYIVDETDGTDIRVGDKTVKLRKLDTTYTTNAEGLFEVTGTIASGTYYFKEIGAPDGYTYNPNEVWRSVYVTENNEYIVQYVNYPDDVEGIKYGENGVLSGAVLALFDNQTYANNMISTLRTSYNGVTNSALTEAVIEANKDTWHIDQVVTSDGEGKFEFENLTAGKTYYVVELIAPTDYQLDYTAHEFTVGASTRPSVTITDKKLHKIILEKKFKLSNGAAEALSGAEFTIYPDNNGSPAATPLTTKMTETAAGHHESGPLPAGTYWLAETNFPGGYTLAGRTGSDYVDHNGERYYKVELTDSADNNYFVTNPVYNVHPQGKFVLRKVSSKSDDTEVAATFSVEKWNATTSKFETYTAIPSITTPANNSSANPKFTSGYMDPGVYKLTETVTEDGYTKSAVTIYIEIDAGKITDSTNSETRTIDGKSVTVYTPTASIGTPIKVTNDPKGELWIYKTGSFNGTGETPLNGVTFEIYRKTLDVFAETEVKIERDGGFVTDASGYIKVTGLDAGSYWVRETGIGDNTGYSVNSTVFVVTVAAGQVGTVNNQLHVDNDSKLGQFKVKKVDDVTGDTISGVTFKILTSSGVDTDETMVTGSDGVALSPMLEPGIYRLKEIDAPTGYDNTANLGADKQGKDLAVNYIVEADKVNDYTTTLIANEHIKSLVITKHSYKDTDGDNVKDEGETVNPDPLSGAVFGLYTDSTCETLYGEATTDGNGTATWNGLLYGTYYLKELSAPAGYTPDATVHTIVIAENLTDATFTYTRDMYNAEIGGVIIEKKILWQNNTSIVGENVSFDLYAASSVVEGVLVEGATKIVTLTTGADGKTPVQRLAPGDYVLIEQSNPAYNAPAAKEIADNPGNFIDSHHHIHFRVVGSNINQVFTGDNAIENTANYGKFHFVKRAKTSNGDEWISLGGAQYELLKLNGTDWVPVNPNNALITVLASGYTSPELMVPGSYRLIERVAPNAPNGYDVEFVVDSKPVDFEIKAGETAEAYQVDGIKRDLKIVKVADDKNDSVRLNGVTFEIYQAAEGFNAGVVSEYAVVDENTKETLLAQYAVDANPDVKGINPIQTKTTANINGENGVAIFEKLTPGAYLLVETDAPDGYGLKALIVNVAPTDLMDEAVYELEDPIVNKSLQGKILILKEDSQFNPIGGAVFKIYPKDDQVECDHTNCHHEVDTVVIGADGYGRSKLLDIGDYDVVEVKAPSGYTLDKNLTTLKKVVSVSGDQTPFVKFDPSSGYTDGVVFKNRHKDSIGKVNSNLDKLVRLNNEPNFVGPFVLSNDSLMLTDVTAEFRITNLTDSVLTNELALTKFVVTDESVEFLGLTSYDLKMDSYDPKKDSEKEFTAVANPTSDDYVMNYIKIGRAYNIDETKLVSAKVYAKVGNKNAEWEVVKELTDVSSITESIMVDLPDNAVGFKVEYSNADAGFQAGAIDVEVTFKKRTSNAEVPQVLVVKNTAMLEWEDTRLDENGQPNHQHGEPTASVRVAFKPYEAKMPELELKHDIINRPLNDLYYSGGTVDLVTVGGVPALSPAELEHPVMSINLPPYTTLDTAKYSALEGGINGIRATITSETSDRNGNILQFKIKQVEPVLGEDEDNYEKYVLDFGPDFKLKPGESIKLEYTANISLNVPDNKITLYAYGLIGSAKQLSMTSENKTGMSYQKAGGDGSSVITDDGFDNGLMVLGNTIAGGDLTYLRRPADIELARADSRLIRKYVSVDKETWHMTEVPTVKPGDNYYYKLVLVNGGDAAERARIIDIMPFDGDTQEFRAMSGGSIMARQTNLPYGQITTDENKNLVYEQVQLVAVEAQEKANTKVTVYYYVEDDNVTENVMNRDWTAANRGLKTAVEELPMLTSNKDAKDVWTGNWTTVCPADMRTVTAIGIEVEYLNGTCLNTGDSYEVMLTMRAPGYTAEQMYQYQTWQNEDVLIANTTAAVVTKVGADADDPVQVVDRVSSNEVFTKLYITTGSIGDYAFYDNNDNGIQDEGDIPARNIPVTLYRRKVTTATVGEPQWEVYKETYTDQTTGEYLFDELPCNYLEPGKTEGSKDPADYIGNTYYEYLVRFGIPEGYSATIREAGNDRAVDSNINAEGWAGATFVEVEENGQKQMVAVPIVLALTLDENGDLQGEVNPTIDAGYVKLVNLGDYVWVDYNKNGVQDESEPGVNGATVNLYKLESAEDTIIGKDPYKTQLTDTKDGHDGYYCFTDLPKGYYVVEFDITTVDKQTGYTEKYAFTVNDAGSNGADSDAKFEKNDNDQIMYTEVIHLTEDDMTWDAGLTVYSALGGFVFDDQDYNDTQSIPTEVDEETTANGIPLKGTVVTLYEVREDGSMNPVPIGQQTVGEDGRYFFDYLEAGRYKVHFDYPDEYIGVKDGVGDYLHDSETEFFDDSTLNSGFTDIIELPVDTADLTHDAGAYLLSSIGDYVWEDIDRDGIQDEDEAPVKDITVTLQQKLGDGEWTTIETTVTDKNGLYLFEGLKSSDHYDVQYRVAFAIPLTVELTGDNIGENRAEDSNALPELDVEYGYFTNNVKPPYGEDDLTIDAGLYYKDGLCEVGDYVWYDDDKDGVQDKDEEGVEGIVVVLEKCTSDDIRDEDAWEFVAKTETDENGKYIFKGLEAGRYRIAFGLGEPWIVTVSRVGDAALDSDAIRQVEDYYYTSAFFLNVGDSDMTWDAGIYKPTIIVVPPTTEPTEPPTEPTVPPTEPTEPSTEPSEPPTEPTEPDPIIPSTGDSFNMAIWMAIMLSAVTMLAILLKKVTK